jgi:hypothetical protein
MWVIVYASLTDDALRQYINRSTSILDNDYREDFPGVRNEREQALEWPRIGANYTDGWYIDNDLVPTEIKNATAELVYGIMVQSADTQPIIKTTGKVISEETTVDVITEKKTYSEALVTGVSRDIVTAVKQALSRIIPFANNSGGHLPIRT